MANFFNLTLDTTAPAPVTVKINGDAEKTNSTAATLSLTCVDADTTGYQMKIWGDIVDSNNPTALGTALTQEAAQWETFAAEKSIVLTTGDGTKNVFVLVRDDVWNCTQLGYLTQTDSIILATKVPVVSITGPDRSKISKVETKNISKFSFTVDDSVNSVSVVLVSDPNAAYNNTSNKVINFSDTSFISVDGNTYDLDLISANKEITPPIAAGTTFNAQISAIDLADAVDSDGVYVIKVFARSSVSGNWSI